jgi:hypothetical protein
MLRTVLICTLFFSGVSSAQIYKTTDENGNVVFTDTPPADSSVAEQVHIRELNTAPPPAQQTSPTPAPETSAQQAPEFSVAITEPANESTIPNGPGNFSVRGSLKPALKRGQLLQLYLSGEPWSDPQRSPAWELVNVFRGAHDLTIGVLDSDGKSLAISEPVRVYVHRPSINFRNRN